MQIIKKHNQVFRVGSSLITSIVTERKLNKFCIKSPLELEQSQKQQT